MTELEGWGLTAGLDHRGRLVVRATTPDGAPTVKTIANRDDGLEVVFRPPRQEPA